MCKALGWVDVGVIGVDEQKRNIWDKLRAEIRKKASARVFDVATKRAQRKKAASKQFNEQ